jgi:nucleoside-diphosphate-sugar epimerase
VNILITGVMGHVGFALALKAVEKSHSIIGLYNNTKDKYKIKILKKKRN